MNRPAISDHLYNIEDHALMIADICSAAMNGLVVPSHSTTELLTHHADRIKHLASKLAVGGQVEILQGNFGPR